MTSDRTKRLEKTCDKCGETFVMMVNPADYDFRCNGGLIQECYPYLTPSERELFVSGYCGDCFDAIFDYIESKSDEIEIDDD